MYTFHTTIHAQPRDAIPGPPIALEGQEYPTLSFSRESLSTTTMACSFEEASAALARLARLYCEPDGSFLWVSGQGQPSWQVDGNLYDRNGQLLFVDAKGSCPGEAFDQLLAALGWPGTKLMFQLVRQAVFLDETTFRRHAENA
jgi:hypothetical protein